MSVPSSLTSRDVDLLHHLYKYRVLTTDQICDLFFSNITTTRHRLNRLFKLQLVDRFQPFSPKGSQPMHYVLGHAGYYVVSADWDLSDKKSKTNIKWSRERALAIGRSQRLRHTVGINNFFCKLGAEARRNPDTELCSWIAERHIGYCSAFAKPDAEGRWREGNQQIRFFLEYDRGTENLDRLVKKLDGYSEYYERPLFSEEPSIVLFCFESGRRESGARRVLAGARFTVATTALEGDKRPHEAIWLPVGSEGRRLRLAQLVEPWQSERDSVDDYLDTWDV